MQFKKINLLCYLLQFSAHFRSLYVTLHKESIEVVGNNY